MAVHLPTTASLFLYIAQLLPHTTRRKAKQNYASQHNLEFYLKNLPS